ncbi:hypothetical protein [Haloferula sp. BvORR071]|uniref:hypothetical protein n=1 Tax=Haloferula sp. BvORR071 TaxID=1396141 RepID=UPI000553F210|nr:hypothetical protein [Haloferula sp. BvORR071]
MNPPPVDFTSLAIDADGLPEIFQRIPETAVTKFFTGLYMLDVERRREVSQAAISYAEAYIQHLIDPALPRPQASPLMPEVKSLGASHSSDRCMSLKLLKQWTGAMKSAKPGARRMSGPVNPALISHADKFETIPATEMRKLLKAHLADRFQLKAERSSGGPWHYLNPGRHAGVAIDFSGSWGQQLRYRILHPRARLGVSLETVWNIGSGDWDFIHRGNWDASLAVLGDIYEFFAQVLPAAPTPAVESGPPG